MADATVSQHSCHVVRVCWHSLCASLTFLPDCPLLQDQRLSFRLKRQQFIELLRQETPEADSAALGEAHLHRAVPGGQLAIPIMQHMPAVVPRENLCPWLH